MYDWNILLTPKKEWLHSHSSQIDVAEQVDIGFRFRYQYRFLVTWIYHKKTFFSNFWRGWNEVQTKGRGMLLIFVPFRPSFTPFLDTPSPRPKLFFLLFQRKREVEIYYEQQIKRELKGIHIWGCRCNERLKLKLMYLRDSHTLKRDIPYEHF